MVEETNKLILSILIATVEERQKQFTSLMQIFNHQLDRDGLRDYVEIVFISDNKEISIGKKRQHLLEKATGEWIVFFDDDDMPSNNYIKLIFEGIMSDPDADCMGIHGTMTTNGRNPQTWCHVLGETWRNGEKGEKHTYYRPIIHFNPVKRDLALKAGFKDMHYAEDKDYSLRLNKLVKKQYMINEPLFHYQFSNQIPHNKKYGIR
jgi:cellulose synthase/poly-beta-1,6-N-acetylglucosamine synthase-like glycosyltransferase